MKNTKNTVEVMDGYIMENHSYYIIWDFMGAKKGGLALGKASLRNVYALIYSYTHKDKEAWFDEPLEYILSRTFTKSINTVKSAIKALIEQNLIIGKEEKHWSTGAVTSCYRINEQVLIDKNIWTESDKKSASASAEQDKSEPAPESATPDETSEEIRLYGEYQNVRLTETEYNSLCEEFPKTFVEVTLKRFSEKVHRKYKYGDRSNYETLLTWCREDAEKAEKAMQKNLLTKNLSKIDGDTINNNIHNAFITSSHSLPQAEKEKSIPQKLEFSEILRQIGFNMECEDDDRDYCTIPYSFHENEYTNKSAMKEAIRFLSFYSSLKHSPEYINCVDAVVSCLTELATDEKSLINSRKVYYFDVVDKLNEVIRKDGGLDIMIDNFIKYWCNILNDEHAPIIRPKNYLKTRLWDYITNDKARDMTVYAYIQGISA